MKKLLKLNKKGQIQGVDFALAMMIFMILFAEIIVLSLSFIEPKYQNLDDRSLQLKSEQIVDTFFSSSGIPQNWEYLFDSTYNSFGLKETGTTNLDPNKISRVNPLAYRSLSYDNVKGNLTQDASIGFQMRLLSIFDVSTQLSLGQPLTTINISSNQINCKIWIFLILPNNTVLSKISNINTTTSQLVTFNMGADPLSSGIYTAVIIAQHNSKQFAIDYVSEEVGTATSLGLEMTVQEVPDNNGKLQIQSKNRGGLSSLTATVVYPYQTGSSNNGTSTLQINNPESEETLNLSLPTNGTAIILLSGNDGGSFSRSVFLFPCLLNKEFNTVFGSEALPTDLEIIKINRIVTIRECIYQVELYLWSE
ncbi:MAG: hypothetical protein U9O98_08975 [Asgard group archaeon]|nr:hypothetical protein [Asgard group archaeon]